MEAMRNKIITGVVALCMIGSFICPTLVYGVVEDKKDDIKIEVHKLAERYGLDYSLIMGQIQLESNFNNESISSAGAFGIMQLMEGTARWMYDIMIDKGELPVDTVYNPRDWKQNLHLGIYHMNWLLDTYCAGGRDETSYQKAFGYYWMGIGGYPIYMAEKGIDTSYSRIVFGHAENYTDDMVEEDIIVTSELEVTSRGMGPRRLKEFENEISIELMTIRDIMEGGNHGQQDDQRGVRSESNGGLKESQRTTEEEGNRDKEESGRRLCGSQGGESGALEKEMSKAVVYALCMLSGIVILLHIRSYHK
jgi:hypothetical protein